jgi:heterodisulfide reductase subunit C
MLSTLIFIIILSIGIGFFSISIRRIVRNIRLGREVQINDQPMSRWKNMFRVALGQSKMVTRPVAGFFHIIIYAGFIIINIEVLEIIIDGIFGTHRVFAQPLGSLYDMLIASFEILALLVVVACVVFFARRAIIKLKRFTSPELAGFPNNDAMIILGTEVVLMSLFLFMNAADQLLQSREVDHYIQAGSFPISVFLVPLISGMGDQALMVLERTCWWLHIIGILAFLNYVPFSKHFHIFLSFPNVWYSRLDAKGKFTNNETVANEVRLMLDPAATPPDGNVAPTPFGAKDVRDLSWKNIMDAYSCTECGRCTSSCPANITGKKLSPRKIMMDTRDRVEEVGRNLDRHGENHNDGKTLLNDYVTPEELWACTTCNACVEACPVNIDPLSIIVEMRRYLVMEQSAAPTELNGMFTKIENNGAPWQFSQADRMNWTQEG